MEDMKSDRIHKSQPDSQSARQLARGTGKEKETGRHKGRQRAVDERR